MPTPHTAGRHRGVRPGSAGLVLSDSGKGFSGDIAYAVARGLNRVHIHVREALENVRHLVQLHPVVLQVLVRGEMLVATIKILRDVRQGA